MSISTLNDPPDPILDELHATRRRLLKEHGGVSGLAAFLRQEEAKTARPMAAPKSPLDVPGIDLHLDAQQIVEFIHAGRCEQP